MIKQTDQLILEKWSRLWIKLQQNRTYHLVDFAVRSNYKVKIKEIKMVGKYWYLALDLKTRWNIGVNWTLSDANLGTVAKSLERVCFRADQPLEVINGLRIGLEELEIIRRPETIQSTYSWDLPEYWEETNITEVYSRERQTRER